MKSVTVAVKDFFVRFKQSERGNTDVEVYVDGNLNESSQHTWYMRKLLDRAIELQEEVDELRKENAQLRKERK